MNEISKQVFIKNINEVNAHIDSAKKEIAEHQLSIDMLQSQVDALMAQKQGMVDDVAEADLNDIAGKVGVEAITKDISVSVTITHVEKPEELIEEL